MAVVVGAENGKERKLAEQGLDISPHRERMDQLDGQGHDLEYRFKDQGAPLQLLFVCAIWLTGFGAPTASTLSLDKPQKNQTRMQTVARANRISAHRIGGVEKTSDEVVDYYGVLGRLKKAVKDYDQGDEDKPPIRDNEELFGLLDAAIVEAVAICAERDIDMEQVLDNGDVFAQVGPFAGWPDRLFTKGDRRKT